MNGEKEDMGHERSVINLTETTEAVDAAQANAHAQLETLKVIAQTVAFCRHRSIDLNARPDATAIARMISEQKQTLEMENIHLKNVLKTSREIQTYLYDKVFTDQQRAEFDELSVEKPKGAVIFLTGLSGSGKSTIANSLNDALTKSFGKSVTLLDGDIIRQHLSKGLGFSREDRAANIERIGYVASEIAKHGGIAICAAIAPYRDVREKVREMVSKQGTFLEVHICTPLEVCETRDPKGLYKQARAGTLKGFTGVDDPYEPPPSPELLIDTSNRQSQEVVEEVMALLKRRGLL